MIKMIKGDILQSDCNVICHQVNENGYMGGGIALTIARRYPEVEEKYMDYCDNFENPEDLYGDCLVCEYDKDRYIANCFTQRNFVTNLEDVRNVFDNLIKACIVHKYTIGMPYHYGCGIAKGNWQEIYNIIEELTNKYNYEMRIYQLED